MEEKKLTDEEIVKALECCAVGRKCRECPYVIKKIDCFLWQMVESDLLDLIHRLQDENERLTEGKNEIWDERNRICKGYWETMDEYKQYREQNAELQKQVDELKIYLASEKVCSKQAVKETAKDILQAVLEDVGEFYAGDIVEQLSKRYGVEVE